MLPSIEQRLALQLAAKPAQVAAAVALLDEGATVPFIARYRKEATGGLDDIQLRLLEERCGPLSGMSKCLDHRLPNGVEVVSLPHPRGELGSVLAAVRKNDKLADVFFSCWSNFTKKRIRENLGNFLEAGPLPAYRRSQIAT